MLLEGKNYLIISNYSEPHTVAVRVPFAFLFMVLLLELDLCSVYGSSAGSGSD